MVETTQGSTIVLDMQGLSDGNQDGLTKLFLFTVLLSSVTEFHVDSHFNDHVVATLSGIPTFKSILGNDVRTIPLPKLFITLLDGKRLFEQELIDNKSEVDATPRLTEVLREKNDNHDEVAHASLRVLTHCRQTRRAIREMWPDAKLLILQPSSEQDEAWLASMPAGAVPDVTPFWKSVRAAHAITSAACKPKIMDGVELDGASSLAFAVNVSCLRVAGNGFVTLAQQLATAINSGHVNAPNAVTALLQSIANAARAESDALLAAAKSRLELLASNATNQQPLLVRSWLGSCWTQFSIVG